MDYISAGLGLVGGPFPEHGQNILLAEIISKTKGMVQIVGKTNWIQESCRRAFATGTKSCLIHDLFFFSYTGRFPDWSWSHMEGAVRSIAAKVDRERNALERQQEYRRRQVL
jgi:hypothetical protein